MWGSPEQVAAFDGAYIRLVRPLHRYQLSDDLTDLQKDQLQIVRAVDRRFVDGHFTRPAIDHLGLVHLAAEINDVPLLRCGSGQRARPREHGFTDARLRDNRRDSEESAVLLFDGL